MKAKPSHLGPVTKPLFVVVTRKPGAKKPTKPRRVKWCKW